MTFSNARQSGTLARQNAWAIEIYYSHRLRASPLQALPDEPNASFFSLAYSLHLLWPKRPNGVLQWKWLSLKSRCLSPLTRRPDQLSVETQNPSRWSLSNKDNLTRFSKNLLNWPSLSNPKVAYLFRSLGPAA